jgi:hypothetical protein
VEILRIDTAEQAVVRFLGEYAPFGMLTHVEKNHSKACPGPDACPPADHRKLTLWKAYAPVERWLPGPRLWSPKVLEITEALEESLHGRVLRGEVWLLERLAQHRKTAKLVGLLCEKQAPEVLPASFDILPILFRFYHTLAIKFGIQNPVPRSICLPDSAGPAPRLPEERFPQPVATESTEDARRVLDEIRQHGGMARMAERAAQRQSGQNGQKGG